MLRLSGLGVTGGPGGISGRFGVLHHIPWRSLAAELVGTTWVLFAALLSVAANYPVSNRSQSLDGTTSLVAAASYGASYTIMGCCLARVSGAHFNPALTLACILTKKTEILTGIGYIFTQVVGGILAALMVQTCIPLSIVTRDSSLLGAGTLGQGVEPWQGLLAEVLLTFLFTFVFFGTVLDQNGMGKLAPFAVGLTLTTCSLAGFSLSGGSLNPARNLGAAIVVNDLDFWEVIYVWLIGPCIGSLFAAGIYEYLFASREVSYLPTAYDPIIDSPGSIQR